MIPKIEDYKILSEDGKYYVLDPYDLFAMPCLKRIDIPFMFRDQAQDHIEKCFEMSKKEYERLKKLGRSFPDND